MVSIGMTYKHLCHRATQWQSDLTCTLLEPMHNYSTAVGSTGNYAIAMHSFAYRNVVGDFLCTFILLEFCRSLSCCC